MAAEQTYVLGEATYRGLMDLLGGAQSLPAVRRPSIPRRAPEQPVGMTWVKVTSGTTSQVGLSGGGQVAAYNAQWSYYDSTAGAWTDNDPVWFLPANGETPNAGDRYLCKLAGTDAGGKGMFLCEMQGPSAGGGGGAVGGSVGVAAGTTTIPTGSLTPVSFPGLPSYNTGGFTFDFAGNPILPAAGLYLACGLAYWNNLPSGTFTLSSAVNIQPPGTNKPFGSVLPIVTMPTTGFLTAPGQTLSVVFQARGGEAVGMEFEQNSGSNCFINSAFLTVTRLA